MVNFENPSSPEKGVLESLRRWRKVGGVALLALFASGQIPTERPMAGEERTASESSAEAPGIDVTPRLEVRRGRVEMRTNLNEGGGPVAQEYARQFDSAKALNKADYAKLVDAVEQDIRHQQADAYAAVSNQGYDAPVAPKARITAIRIKGLSSPEAFQFESPTHRSVKPGQIEAANVRLAAKRGNQAVSDMRAADVVGRFRAAGMDIDQATFEDAARDVQAEEAQFTDSEIKELEAVSAAYPTHVSGGDAFVNVARLVELYNTGQMTNAEHRQILENIVASKRRVDIQVDYEYETPTVVSVAAPLVFTVAHVPLVTPAEGTHAWRRLLELYDPRNRPGQEFEDESRRPGPLPPTRHLGEAGPPQPTPARPPQWLTYEPPKAFEKPTPNPFTVRIPPVPDKPTAVEVLPPRQSRSEEVYIAPEVKRVREVRQGDEGYEWMVWQTVVKDLEMHFNDPQTLGRGVDYALVAHDMYRWYDRLGSDQDRVDAAAQLLLQQWIAHDVLARREAGERDVSTGLDYFDQPEKIRWAKLHARVLLDMVKQKRRQDAAFGQVEQVASRNEVGWTLNDPVRAAYTRMVGERAQKVRKKYPQFEA